VILDLHAVPGGQSNTHPADPPPGGAMLWKDEADQAQLVAIWSSLAARYRNSETVAGYDLINECHSPDPTSSRLIPRHPARLNHLTSDRQLPVAGRRSRSVCRAACRAASFTVGAARVERGRPLKL
jgi:Cellulase (glycosyl hydrolase family 5)